MGNAGTHAGNTAAGPPVTGFSPAHSAPGHVDDRRGDADGRRRSGGRLLQHAGEPGRKPAGSSRRCRGGADRRPRSHRDGILRNGHRGPAPPQTVRSSRPWLRRPGGYMFAARAEATPVRESSNATLCSGSAASSAQGGGVTKSSTASWPIAFSILRAISCRRTARRSSMSWTCGSSCHSGVVNPSRQRRSSIELSAAMSRTQRSDHYEYRRTVPSSPNGQAPFAARSVRSACDRAGRPAVTNGP